VKRASRQHYSPRSIDLGLGDKLAVMLVRTRVDPLPHRVVKSSG